MTSEPEWGWLIVLYLFLAGLGAGAFVFAAAAALRDPAAYRRLGAWGAYLAPWPVAVGTGFLLLDLGRPFAAFWLFSRWRLASPMSWGVWLLTLFILLALAHGYLWLPERLRPRSPARPLRLRRRLAQVGIPLGLGVAVYTALLLGAAMRPLWQSPLLAPVFLVSAVSTGVASLMTLGSLGPAARAGGWNQAEKHLLLRWDAALIATEIFLVALLVLYGLMGPAPVEASVAAWLAGPLAPLFWVGLVLAGLAAPLALEWGELRGIRLPRAAARWLPALSGTLVLVGGLVLRYLVVYGGQRVGWWG
ncbi:NrfD/PsrC family molybdoenzyme membrane anchor subunit [Limnochorda pilosa]|uniref:Polysulfide reductase NrfD n=1 Tax=Limnochorda pilosa TaxID=1555112 RepID=A0A0K2SJA2_LIMPI|nr:NrfD/PsrC family molybdoenzyme membrane anchor subunit [Limnochorda pilosa]BAS27196.1 polysulfide reductase NrfD [Limnochorda pilosa]